MISAGYSGTPLPKKLGLSDGQNVLFVGLPASLQPLKSAGLFRSVESADWTDLKPVGPYDVVHLFTDLRAHLDRHIAGLLQAIARDGMIWVSWPKKASKVPTDMTEDVVREVALPIGLVDVKVCAVDEIWSGLKLVIRKELR